MARKNSQQSRKKKRKESYTGSEVKRYLGALQEHADDKFDAIKEYFDGKIDGIEGKIDGIYDKLSRHEKILDSHTEMMGNLSLQLHTIKEDIEIISSNLTRKMDRDEFATLQRRVSLLEKRVMR